MSIPKKTFKILVLANDESIYGRFENLSTEPIAVFRFMRTREEYMEFYFDIFGLVADLIRIDVQSFKLIDHNIEMYFNDQHAQNEFKAMKEWRRPGFNHHFINLGNQTHTVRPLLLNDIENG